jgi:hypothetical protein
MPEQLGLEEGKKTLKNQFVFKVLLTQRRRLQNK